MNKLAMAWIDFLGQWRIGISIFSAILLLFSCSKDLSGTIDGSGSTINPLSMHPFLIVKKEDFERLRERASAEPWKSMKLDAINRSNAGSETKAYSLQDYIGAAALAYILDPGNAQVHADRVHDAIINQYAKLEVKDGGDWGGVVPNLGSFFMAILALDIVYDALDLKEIKACEEVISNQIFKINRKGSWQDVRLGTHGTWDIYKGDRKIPDDDYYRGIMQQITEDGVSPVTIHYAWERVGGGDSRLSKAGYMDVLEYTGIDRRYYQNDRLQKFQRWLFGSSINNSKEMAIIGDMLPTQKLNNDMLHRRVVNFDDEAAGYAAWFHDGRQAKGSILTYILPKKSLPDPVEPESKLYTNGGAFFREKGQGTNGLHLVLYNIKSQDEWHTHQEVNGLALSGYGNRLLVNGGRLGSPVRSASLNNTLTINGEDHRARVGGGLLEGFITTNFDYASSDSGPALVGSHHQRNVLFVKTDIETRPYVILIDEVRASAGDQIINYLHPANESSVEIITPKTEFLAKIDHYPSKDGAWLTLFYATEPSEVKIEKVAGAVPDRYPNYPDHNRLASVYQVDEGGERNLLSILMPHSIQHPKPSIKRLSNLDFSGAEIVFNNQVKDLVITRSMQKTIEYEDWIFSGEALLLRSKNDIIDFYFVKKGTRFTLGKTGFRADDPISIYFGTHEGVITSGGTRLVLLGEVSTAKFETEVVVLNSDTSMLEVVVPKGETRFSR